MLKRFLALAALPLLMAQTAPPANVTMQNGQPRAVTPTASYCVDGTNTWVPCPTASGGGGGGGTTPTGTAGSPNVNVVTVQGIAGAVAQPSSVASGANVVEGALGDTPYTGTGNSTLNGGIRGIYNALVAPTPAGNFVIGKVGIDQTTDGVTNGVRVLSAPDVQGSGTLALGTLNSTYVIPLTNGRSSVGTKISGLTGSGATVTVQRSNDNQVTWTSANTTESSTTGSLSSTLTADGQPRIGAAGATHIRFIVTTAGTGTATVAYNATTAAGPTFMVGYLPSRTTPDGGVIGGVDNRFINGTAISTGTGTADTGTQRTVTASNSPDVTALTSMASTVGTPGTTAPATAQEIGGIGPSGGLRTLLTDTRGALQSQQVTYLDSQPVALTASATAVQIDSDVDTGAAFTTMTAAQRAARVYFTVTAATAPSVPAYLCFGGQLTACNATHYSALLPAGSIGVSFFPPAGTGASIYAYSTAAVTLKVSSQIAQ